MTDRQDYRSAIVIGSGFGGLALAIRLQSAGVATTIVEARDKPGGRAYYWQRDGHVFDAGPTVITDPDCLQRLWALSGQSMENDVELLPVSPFYALDWPDGTRFDYTNDDAYLFEQITRLNPADVAGYKRFLAYAAGVYEEGYLKLGTKAFEGVGDMVKAAPALARYQAWRSVYSIVAKFVQDEHLRQALSFHTLLVGGNPMNTSAIYALIHKLERDGGVWFAKGGTNRLVAGMVALFERLGGTLRLGDKVDAIEVVDGRARGVRTASGWRGEADAVASNGDVVASYGLIEGSARGPARQRALKRKSFSPSLFVLHFGLEGTSPDIPHHMILFGPRYRDLLGDIYDRGVIADDPALYLHHPTRTDPSMAPSGCSTFYALAPVPHLGKAPVDWAVEGPRYAEVILDTIEQRLIPDVRARIRTRFHYAPDDFQSDLFAHLGSAFSLSPVLWQSAWFRQHNRDDVIPNLYFVGAGTHPGAGIPGVVGSAEATAGLMLGMTVERDRLVAEAGQSIALGSKSFRFASQIFDRPTRERSWLLYAWCRACDDITDGQTLGHDARVPADPAGRLAFLRATTDAALGGIPTGLVPFDALAQVAAETGISPTLPHDHLGGFARDAAGWRPTTEQDLLSYCYQVAGAVGVMMAHVMGVGDDDSDTLDRASDLGIAFQLANIARDIVDDWRVGRCYLPTDWLAAEGLADADLADPVHRDALARIARHIAALALSYRRSSMVGAARLPFRRRWAVLSAGRIYGEVASRAAALGPRAWDRRISTRRRDKLMLVAAALGDAMRTPRPVSRAGLWTRPPAP